MPPLVLPKNAIHMDDLVKASYRFGGMHALFIMVGTPLLALLACCVDLRGKRSEAVAGKQPDLREADSDAVPEPICAEEAARQARYLEEMLNRRKFLEFQGADHMGESTEEESEAENEKPLSSRSPPITRKKDASWAGAKIPPPEEEKKVDQAG